MNRARISIGSIVLAGAALVGCVTEDANNYYDRQEPVGRVIDDGYSAPASAPSQTQYQLTSTAAPQSNYGSPEQAYPSANGVDAVSTMYQEGVSEQAILDFIATSNYPYDPSADEINALFERGVSSRIVVAMIERGEDVMESGAAEEEAYASANYATSENVAPAPAAAYAPQSNVPDVRQDYYRELAPHGDWVYVSDYGWGWRPRVAVRSNNWRPYFDDGYWRYSDVGWYWTSTYDWGWLPFHYGRWNHHSGRGWVWYPGDTWGPAWVSWRTHPDYFGWAPLPYHATYHTGVGFYYRGDRVSFSYGFGLSSFHYSFIPRRHFASRNFHRHRVAGNVHYNCYTHSEVHHHYDYHRGHRSPVNKGVHVHEVEKAAGRKIDRVALRKADVGVVRRNRAGRGAKDVVYRPNLEDGQGVRGQGGPGRVSAGRSGSVTSASRRSASPTERSLRSALAKETSRRRLVGRSSDSNALTSSPTSNGVRSAARKATVPQGNSIANRSVSQPRSSSVSSSQRTIVSRSQAPTASPSASRSAVRKPAPTQRSYGPANGSVSTSRRSSSSIPVRSSVTPKKRVTQRDLSGSSLQSSRSYMYGVNRSVSTPTVRSRSQAPIGSGRSGTVSSSRSAATRQSPSASSSRNSRSESARAPSSRSTSSYTPSRPPSNSRSSRTIAPSRSVSTPSPSSVGRSSSSSGSVSPRSSSSRSTAAPSRSTSRSSSRSSSKSTVTSRSGGFGSSSSGSRSTSTPSRATVSRGPSSR